MDRKKGGRDNRSTMGRGRGGRPPGQAGPGSQSQASGEQSQQPQAGQQSRRPQAGQQSRRPQAGQQPQRPQTGQQPQRPQAGQQSQRPQTGQQPQRPQAGQQPQRPQAPPSCGWTRNPLVPSAPTSARPVTPGPNAPPVSQTGLQRPQVPPQQLQRPQAPPQQLQHPQAPPQQLQRLQAPPQPLQHPQAPPQQLQRPQAPPQQLQRPQAPPQQLQRPQAPPQQLQRPQAPPQQLQRPQAPPLLGAWGKRATQNPPAPTSAPPVSAQPSAPPVKAGTGGQLEAAAHTGAIPKVPASTSARGRTIRTARAPPLRTKPAETTSKQGKSGNSIALKTNHLELGHSKDVSLYEYRVDFVPEQVWIKMKIGLFREGFGKTLKDYLFDGTVVYTSERVPDQPQERVVKTNNGEAVTITMRHVGNLIWGDYHYIPVFNIIIRKCLKLMNLELIRRDFYDPRGVKEFPFRGQNELSIWPGVFTSTRQCEQNILLNIDKVFKVVSKQTAYDLYETCRRQQRNSTEARERYKEMVLGTVVMTPYNNRTYKIDDVDFDKTPRDTFKKKDGTKYSLVDYYKTRYYIEIKNTSGQPLLVSRGSKREIRGGTSQSLWLVPELCLLTGLTDQQRNNFNMMKDLSKMTRLSAPERVRQLTEFAQKIKADPRVTQEVRKWDVSIFDSLLQLQGRQLGQQTLDSKSGPYLAGTKAEWSKELRTKTMWHQNNIDNFAVITPAALLKSTKLFLEKLKIAASNMNWTIETQKIFQIADDGISSYLNMVESVCNSNNKPQMMLIVLAKSSMNRYGAIKKKCSCGRGVLTQFVLQKQMEHKSVLSIATNIAIQMNAKNKGAPWSVHISLTNIMVCGYDVCRTKTGSYSAIVASMNQNVTQYYSSVHKHENEEELSDTIVASMLDQCKQFKKKQGKLPDRILMYRDGVGDGQIEYVRAHEVENVVKQLTKLYNDYGEKQQKLRMAYVIVTKRINVKFFTMKDENPPPGTIVDDVVTQPERYDFYLTSQCVKDGTVSPTCYNVIYDTMGLSADHLQILTYKLCHMYFNWSGTIKVPAPVQYAHKLAFQTSEALHGEAHQNLRHSLHFL